MHRKSTFKTTFWIILFLGSAFSVNTIRRNLGTNKQAFVRAARTLSSDALIVTNVMRTLFLP
ncbi:hypothetical protein [Fibrella aquatilis]|uniref:Uncharacterized protein n=1 Tax=Fibrella aquatilis TaxID=2817059 RepID=A0A939G6J5_9BACT|nr:hypothetical protein [Fibrella aquatilis]MBO0931305.1 hypothetical protein [Fibrella aquatilis]